MVDSPRVCRREKFLDIVNSVQNEKNKLFKELEKFFENSIIDVTILLDICILFFISLVLLLLLRKFNKSDVVERKSRGEVMEEIVESVEEGADTEQEAVKKDPIVNEEGVVLEVEENKRKKVALVKRKSVSAAPNLQSYRLKYSKPKSKLLTNFDIIQYMLV